MALTFVGYRSLNVNAAAVKQIAVAKEAPLGALTKDLLPRKKLVISVNDSFGKSMKQVRVKVYAKPLRVESSPAIKFSANGGTFFDGTTLMYFRLPYDGCTETEFYDSLTFPNRVYLNQNRSLATRPGFILADKVVSEKERDILRREIAMAPEEKRYYNGQIINLEWLQSNDSHVTTYHLNGGILPFNDKNLTSFKREMAYTTIEQDQIFSEFTSNIKGSNYLVGLSTDEQCSEYAPYGVRTVAEDGLNLSKKKTSLKNPTDYYFCWNNKPDGVYINDIYVKGNMDNCFSTANPRLIDENTISFNQYTGTDFISLAFNSNYLYIKNLATEGLELNLVHQYEDDGLIKHRLCTDDSCVQAKTTTTYPEITKLEIVNHGKVIVTITSSDIERTTDDSNVAHNLIKNVEKRDIINNYFGNFKDTCIKESLKPIEIK